MRVNEERLKHFVKSSLVDACFRCPLRDDNVNCKHRTATSYEEVIRPCEDYILEWLQQFDVADALEQGAHIVNDRIIFPPEEIPVEPIYGTPCEVRNERGKESLDCDECEYLFDCPYSVE